MTYLYQHCVENTVKLRSSNQPAAKRVVMW